MDAIAVIEAAYADAPTDHDWMDGLLRACRPLLDCGYGLTVWTFDARDPQALKIGERRFLGEDPRCFEAIDGGSARLAASANDPRMRAHLHPFSTFSSALTEAEFVSVRAAMRGEVVFGDMFGLVGADPTGLGIAVGGLLPEPTTPTRAEVRRWSRVAAHLAAGYRLRRAAADDGDAVLEPCGKVAHAEGDAKGANARAALSRAAVAVDRARGALRRQDNDEAIEAWQGLVTGRWSLVERFEKDGRRYLIARKNDPRVGLIPTLSDREQQVLLFRVFGHPLKLIAYELGLSIPTVSRTLQGAMGKLGLRSPADLLALLAPPASP